jgi:predicted metal-dependent peptidase
VAETTPLPSHRGTRAVQRLVEFAPSTGGLALWVHHRDLPADAAPGLKVPIVATDGHAIFYAADFERLPVALQAGWVAHEVLHIALRHAQRFVELRALLGDVDAQLFNICADAIVNSALGHLAWLQLPASAVFLEKLVAGALSVEQSAESALLEWDVETLYRAIDDRRLPQQGRGQRESPRREDGPRAERARAMGAENAPDLLPDAGADEAPERQAEQAREWRERLLRGHAGDGDFSMLRTLVADLPKTHTPWEQVLRVQLARALSLRPGLSWSRPSRSYLANQGRAGPHRRMPWEPGFSPAKAVPRLVLVVDVSGSIADELLDRFAREVEAITRRLEAGLTLVMGDDRVQRVTSFEPGRSDLREIQFQGGGGTDFTPLLEEAERLRPDLIVVLTDLEGPANFRPRRPVIWAVPESPAPVEAPFGRLLRLR